MKEKEKESEREKEKGKCTHLTVFRTKPTTTTQKMSNSDEKRTQEFH
jgi:hypothetical protein